MRLNWYALTSSHLSAFNLLLQASRRISNNITKIKKGVPGNTDDHKNKTE